MKDECQIVRDLLLGYKDETLHDASKKLVKNHLEECKACKEVFKIMQDENEKSDEIEAIDGLEKVNKKIKKKNIIIKVISIILIIFILYSIIAIINYNSTNNMEVFFNDEITEEEQENVEKAILEIDNEAEIKYDSKEEGLEKFKSQIEEKELLDGYEGENNPFPASFVIKAKRSKLEKINSKLLTMPQIRSITINTLDPYTLLAGTIYVKIFK